MISGQVMIPANMAIEDMSSELRTRMVIFKRSGIHLVYGGLAVDV